MAFRVASLNPFHKIYHNESSHYIHAHTLRSGFFHKVIDTFSVFSGTRDTENTRVELRHIGIFDLMTLGLPWLLDECTRWCYENFNQNENIGLRVIALLGIIPTSSISALTNTLRYSLATVFTAASLPIVLGIHAVTRIISSLEHARIERTLTESYSIPGTLAENIMNANYKGTSAGGELSFFIEGSPRSKKITEPMLKAALFLNIGGLAKKFEDKGVYPDTFFRDPIRNIDTNPEIQSSQTPTST